MINISFVLSWIVLNGSFELLPKMFAEQTMTTEMHLVEANQPGRVCIKSRTNFPEYVLYDVSINQTECLSTYWNIPHAHVLE